MLAKTFSNITVPTTNATRTVSLSNSTGAGSLNNTLTATQEVSKVGWCERRLPDIAVGRADLQLMPRICTSG